MTDTKTPIRKEPTRPGPGTGLDHPREHEIEPEGLGAELTTVPKPEVKAQLRPEVKAELKSDVRSTLEELASTGRGIEERFARRVLINSPRRHNAKLNALLNRINADDDLYGLWLAANVNAMERLGMTDHGPVHVLSLIHI